MQQRNQSLDALRGYAILTMILSGSIAYGDSLPAWMYHAQVPPPNHTFIETVVGITWVDLVFPFFLFSMGAAIPLALNKHVKNKSNFLPILWIALRRFLLLAFFALFLEHMKAWVLAEKPMAKENLLSIVAFALLFFQLYENKKERYKKLFVWLKISSFIIAIVLLFLLRFREEAFSFTKSDIIIIVLANMAFFGTIIWWFTKDNLFLRIGILPFVMAVFFASKEPEGGWVSEIYNFSHIGTFKFNWLYQFYFLKYLFIIIPGTIAGDYLLKANNENSLHTITKTQKPFTFPITLISLAIVVTNTIFLFTRQLEINLTVSVGLLIMLFYFLHKTSTDKDSLLRKFFSAGAYLLLLGLFFEAYEGGIRKDHSTYSYYFVTSGLAFFMLIAFSSMAQFKMGAAVNNYLSLIGRNPMLAYVAGSLLLMPILQLTGLHSIFDNMNSGVWPGFLKGVIFTGIVSLITIFCTKKGWFWKT